MEQSARIQELVEGLCSKDNKIAYQYLLQLSDECEKNSTVYSYLDRFIQMMGDPNSYIRTRGLVLISANAKWDTFRLCRKLLSISQSCQMTSAPPY